MCPEKYVRPRSGAGIIRYTGFAGPVSSRLKRDSLMPRKALLDLQPVPFMTAEYEYIAQTAFQAHEDRARVTSFYFVSVGSLVVAILSAQFAGSISAGTYLAFSLLFAFLTALGVLTISQLARLRAAWYESILAMNTIKDFVLACHPEYAPAFAWRLKRENPTLTKDKRFSIANLLAMEVALLGALILAACLFCLLSGLGIFGWWGWILMVLAGAAGWVAQMAWYRFLMEYSSGKGESQ